MLQINNYLFCLTIIIGLGLNFPFKPFDPFKILVFMDFVMVFADS